MAASWFLFPLLTAVQEEVLPQALRSRCPSHGVDDAWTCCLLVMIALLDNFDSSSRRRSPQWPTVCIRPPQVLC